MLVYRRAFWRTFRETYSRPDRSKDMHHFFWGNMHHVATLPALMLDARHEVRRLDAQLYSKARSCGAVAMVAPLGPKRCTAFQPASRKPSEFTTLFTDITVGAGMPSHPHVDFHGRVGPADGTETDLLE